MTWFRVDDSFHSHPKVLATDPAALGLWVLAGSWSSARLTDGLVRDTDLPRILPDSEKLARALVAAGLWKRTKGGYQFHEWNHYNPSADEVKEDRTKARDRMRKLRAERNGHAPRGSPERSGEQHANVRQVFATPSRSSSRTSRRGGAASPPTAAANLLTAHPFVDDGTGKSCKSCGVLKSNKIHAGKK